MKLMVAIWALSTTYAALDDLYVELKMNGGFLRGRIDGAGH